MISKSYIAFASISIFALTGDIEIGYLICYLNFYILIELFEDNSIYFIRSFKLSFNFKELISFE
jgi:hypothetical protein